MKRVLFVFHDSHRETGASASMFEVLQNLIRLKSIKVRVVLPNNKGTLPQFLEAENIEYVVARYYTCRYKLDASFRKTVWSFLRAFVGGVITFFSAINFSFFDRRYDTVYSNTTDIYFGILVSVLTGRPHVCHVREFGVEDQSAKQIIGDSNYYYLLDRVSSKIVVISEALGISLAKKLPSGEEKLELIYDDVNLPSVEKKIRNFDVVKMLIVGVLSVGKGQEFLIRAVKQLVGEGIPVELTVVGEGRADYVERLKFMTSEWRLNGFVGFLGFRKDVPKLRDSHNVAVIASSSEAFGRVTIEAMNSWQLVIANDTGANPELVKNGETGFLYKHNDIDSFAGVVREILAKSNEELNEVVGAANDFSNNFVSGSAARQLNSLLKSM